MRGTMAWALVTGLLVGCASKPPHQGKSVEELERMLADPNPRVQVQGAYGLAALGTGAAPAVPTLTRALKAEDALVRQQVAVALGEIGPEAGSAAPNLVVALSDSEWQVRRQAAVALGQIGPTARQAANDALTRCLRDSHHLVRRAATEALPKLRESGAGK